MKQKTSVTLSSDLLTQIDRDAGSAASRSAFIENVLREYFNKKVRQAVYERDLALRNEHADYYNREMKDVLRFQAPIHYETEE
jgi:metal-responsive CopG/Arc/MetJ family transcriptional regulator